MVRRCGKTSPIFSVVEIIKQTVPTILKTAGFRTSSRDSVRLFEGEGKKSVKGLLMMCDGFEDAVVAAIRREQEFLGRKLSTNIRSSEKVNMSIRVALKSVFSDEIQEGSVAVRDNGVSKHGVANYISGVFPV
jgi:hypothetical protein